MVIIEGLEKGRRMVSISVIVIFQNQRSLFMELRRERAGDADPGLAHTSGTRLSLGV